MGWTLSTLYTDAALESAHRRDFAELADAIALGQQECAEGKTIRPARAWVHRKGKPLSRAKWEHKGKRAPGRK